ncbi:unnamed protein product [Calypogeia fissa]
MADPTGLSGIAIGKLVDYLIDEATTTIKCKKNCLAMKKSLQDIKPLVDEAEAKLSTNTGLRPVKDWVEGLQKIFREAEVLVMKCNLKGRRAWMPQYRLAKNIVDVKERIDEYCKVGATLAGLSLSAKIAEGVDHLTKGVDQIPEAVGKVVKDIIQQNEKEMKDQQSTRAHTPSPQQINHKAKLQPISGRTFGVDVLLQNLQHLLLCERKDTSCVGICGKGGVGKTRLAQLAYNSKDVQAHFQIAIWLTVGNDVSLEGLLRRLGTELGLKTDGLKQEDIKTDLFSKLSGKKSLLVLDDVWESTGGRVLNFMLDIMAGLDIGSKILVTTRNFKVLKTRLGEVWAERSIVRMEGLSPQDSWELFCDIAFKDGIQDTDVEKLAKDVAKQCKGLPLALKVVAGAQAGKKSPWAWRKALKKLKNGEDKEDIYNSVQLSYDDLESKRKDDPDPHRLQKCFIYFASFPEDSDVDSEKLVNLWVGEKLLEGYDDTDEYIDPVEEGHDLLVELIERSLIELREGTRSKNVKSGRLTCRVHDVIRDFILHLIKEKRAPMDCLFSPGKRHKKFPDGWLKISPSDELTRDATHLSLNNNRLQSLPERLNAPSLEVLLLAENRISAMFKLVIPPGFLENFSSLKVLDLENTCIDSLPETLGNLTNLTYLELSRTMLTRFPRRLCNLTKLAYLGLSGCQDMEPFAIECLENLSTLNTSECKKVWRAPTTELELGPLCKLFSLTRLRNLSIEDPSCEHLPTQMSQLVNLRYLTMSFQRLKRLPPELHSRDGPKLNKLQYLSLSGCWNLSELPSWIGSLSHLANLDLSRCGKLTYLPNLSELPKLQILQLEGCESLRQLPAPFGSKKPFFALEVLNLTSCTALEEFPSVGEGAFPKLDKLYMQGCQGIKQLGATFASKATFPALTLLNLDGCTTLKQFPSVKQGAFPKLEHLSMQGCEGLKQLGATFASKGTFPALTLLNLNGCTTLEQFPSVEQGAFPKLEHLSMRWCEGLKQLGATFASKGTFPTLTLLNLHGCTALEQFPCVEEGAFPMLTLLNLHGCTALEQFPCVEEGAFPKLVQLFMGGCERLKQLGATFASKGTFPMLTLLNLHGCTALEQFPSVEEGAFPELLQLFMGGCERVKQLGATFASKGTFPALTLLHLHGWTALEHFPSVEEGAFPKLVQLVMGGCEGLRDLGATFASKGTFPALRFLCLDRCKTLEQFPSVEEGAFPKLEHLSMRGCEGLKKLGATFASKGTFPALTALDLHSCRALEEFPSVEEGAFPKLKKLYMQRCGGVKQLGARFASKGTFPALTLLHLDQCTALEQFASVEEGAFPKLEQLSMEGCERLGQLGATFASKGTFPALKVLNLSGCTTLEEFPFVEEEAFSKLERLHVLGCCEGLKQLGTRFASKVTP